jgi:hypothetical protein
LRTGFAVRATDKAAMGDLAFLLIGLGFFAAFGLYTLFCDRQ